MLREAFGSKSLTGGLRSGSGTGPNSAITANSIDALLGTTVTGTAPGIFGIAGIFTNPQFQVVIRALNQKKGVDLMSAPKVTTKSGRKAIVRVAREFPYPTEFNAPEPPPPSTLAALGVDRVGRRQEVSLARVSLRLRPRLRSRREILA